MRKITCPTDFANRLLPEDKVSPATRRAIEFLVVFIALFAILTLVILPLTAPFWEFLSDWNADATSGILSFWGVENDVLTNLVAMQVGPDVVIFEVTSLCAGDLEIALLFALILATPGILFWKKLAGAFIGTAILILINPFRIALTLFLTNTSDLETGELYHSIIFRLFLFALLVLYYLVWYRLAAREDKSRPKKKKKKA